VRVVVADDSMFCGRAGSATCSTTGWRRWTRSAPSQQAGRCWTPRWSPSCWWPGGLTPLAALAPRERDVLRLMAEGRSNAALADALVITGGAVEKQVSNILAKINLPDLGSDNRRVLAVLTWLKAR
jgi:DNA-binding NarL/FixJ family response regulator